jgi:BirA family biotin operon repressor/biotin-[acetyl-CoA-carboxylase] ligase
MTFSQEELQAVLAPRAVRFYKSVDSTNDLAMSWLRAGAQAGSVVIADEQRKGRGRMRRAWQTPPGQAIAMSVILRPPVAALYQVTMLGALAVAEMLDYLGVEEVGIKWPNDVQIGGLKVCGVLPEAAWDGKCLEGVVLGIGINVRVDFRGSELETTAISLETALGKSVDRTGIVSCVLSRVDHWAAQLGADGLFHTWKSRLTTIGQMVTVTNADGNRVTGFAEALDEKGALLLRTDDESVQRIVVGDVH